MSSPSEILHAKTEDLRDRQNREKYTVTVFGCGLIGILHACLFADAGYRVICTDSDQTVLTQLARGKTSFLPEETETKLRTNVKTKRIVAMNEVKTAVQQSDVIVLSLPVEVDSKRKPDYSRLEKSVRSIANCLRKGSLVIMTSIVGLGLMDNLLKQPIEDVSGYKAGVDFGLVYSPISTEQIQTLESMVDYGRIVASSDKKSLETASAILAPLYKKDLRECNNIRTAEIAALFERTKQNVNDALASEFAVFCEKARVDYQEVSGLINTGFSTASLSSTQITEIDDYASSLLLEDSENLNAKLSLVSVTKLTNGEIVKHIVSLTKDVLRSCEKSMRRTRISLLGISSLRNAKSSPRAIIKALTKTLEARGAKVRLYDPYIPELELQSAQVRPARSLSEALEGADCFIVVTAHDTFKCMNLGKLKVLMRLPAAIVDFEGCFDPEKVEKEGFAYRGVGRGAWSE